MPNAAEQRYTMAEHMKLGTERCERDIRKQVEDDHQGRIVALDVDSGVYALGDTVIAAAQLLRQKRPDAQVWLVRVGYPSVHRIGGRSGTKPA